MRGVFLFCCALCLFALPASAKPTRSQIHLIAHSDIGDMQFMYNIKCMLEAVYTLEVIVHDYYDFDFTDSYKNERGQYRAEDLLNRAGGQKHLSDLAKTGYVFYFIQPDMFDKRYRGGNFLLALLSYSMNINVISLARLRHINEDVTTDRVFRLVAKNTAKFNGHKPSGKCFMGFSDSVGILDAREVKLCEPDLSKLKSIGLVQPHIKDGNILKGCAIVS